MLVEESSLEKKIDIQQFDSLTIRKTSVSQTNYLLNVHKTENAPFLGIIIGLKNFMQSVIIHQQFDIDLYNF